MGTNTIAVATEQIKSEIIEGVEKLKEFSGTLKDNFDVAQKEIRRGVQRSRKAAENALEDARYGIKNRPLTWVAASAGGGLVIGLALGWVIGYRRK